MTQSCYDLIIIRCNNCGKEERRMDEVPDDLYGPESIRLEIQTEEIEKWTKGLERKRWKLNVDEEKDYCPECARKITTKDHSKSNLK